MNYYPRHGPHPHPPQNPGHYPPPPGDHYGEKPHHGGGSDAVANIVRIVTGLVVATFVLHILFTVFEANQGNEFVSFVYGSAQVLVLGLGDVFTPDDAVLGVVLNYGLAALIYLVIGTYVIKLLRR